MVSFGLKVPSILGLKLTLKLQVRFAANGIVIRGGGGAVLHVCKVVVENQMEKHLENDVNQCLNS